MDSVFGNWKREISGRIMECKDMQQLKKALSDELYGVNEYMDDSKDAYEVKNEK